MSGVERVRTVHPSGGRVMTKQSMALQTDINNIVARHVAHGTPFFPDGRATYGDFSGIFDYHSCLDAVNKAQEDFERLPASVRDRCDNDPGKFLGLIFGGNESVRAELVKLGLVAAAIPEGAPKLPVDPAPVVAPPIPVPPV